MKHHNMQVLKDLPALSDTPMQKREVIYLRNQLLLKLQYSFLTLFRCFEYLGSFQAETAAVWGYFQLRRPSGL